jgi:sterol desaturase/sphingolipid hydroxylase (fatty acid hydroxylase superfamily)
MPAGGIQNQRLMGPGTEASWINLKLAPGTTDQTHALSFKRSLKDVVQLDFFFESPNLIWFFMALTIHTIMPYDIAGTLTIPAASWILSRFAMNYSVAFVYYGYFHYGLYIAGWGKRKFVPNSYPTVGNMVHNLWYWSLAIVQWTFWEYVMSRIWASGKGAGFITDTEMLTNKFYFVWNVFWMLVIPVWRDLHFYIAHRFIHVRAIYKFVHSLHHRNNDPEPFSGMTMHPIEHLYYFSNAFIPSLFVPHLSPMIFLWNFIHLTIAPGAGHSGFEDNFQADQYHFVHHAKFECNYGSPFSAFIDQYFGTFREKLGESTKYTGEYKNNYEEEQKKIHKIKVWSSTGYLGLPASKTHFVYTLFWVALMPFTYWAVVSNHDGNTQLHVTEFQGIPIEEFAAIVIAYLPVIMALVLCWLSGDKLSWRWPFQKESVFGAFGLFLLLGWLACVLPVYFAVKASCSPVKNSINTTLL